MRLFLMFLVFLAFLLFGRWYFVCQVRGLCGEAVPVDTRLPTLTLTDGDSVVLSGFDHFAFTPGQVSPDLNDNNRLFLDKAAEYLLRKGAKQLTITGVYRLDEEGARYGFYENLGVARADEVRKMLMSRGILEERISLDHRIDSTNDLRRPLAFEAFSDDGRNRSLFTFTNMTFSDANFEFGSAEFRPGTPFIAYADSVKVFFDLNPEKLLTIVGHTDSIDTDQFNYRLGMDRARNARQYFVELGIDGARITVNSKGETMPVSTNSTEEGRQKNRRVEFVIE